MRKSSTTSRLLAAGLTAGTVGAALLAAPTAAQAVAITSAAPSFGTTGTTVTLTAPSNFFTGTTVGVILTTLASCPATYTTTAASPAVSFAGTNPVRVSGTSATFQVPTTATLNAGAARAYNICAYAGTASTSALLNDATPTLTYTLLPTGTTNPATGPSGGGNTVTITAPAAAPLEAYNIARWVPREDGCPATWGAADAAMDATLVPNSGSTSVATATVPVGVGGQLGSATNYGICVYSHTSAVVAGTAPDSLVPTYTVTLPTVTLNTAIGGPGSTTAALTMSSTTDFLTGVSAPAALYGPSTGRCPTTYPTSTTGYVTASVLKSANNRAAVTLPAGVTTSAIPYNVCVYTSTSTNPLSRIIAHATYTATTPPDVTGISPGAGSSRGGETVTITGTNLSTVSGNITATLGGLPMTNITAINSNTFTAVTPAHAGENDVALVVKTEVGSDTLAGQFDFLNAIDVTPNTASNKQNNVWVNVRGTGFESYTWPTAAYTGPSDNEARVWLLDGSRACTSASPVICPQNNYLAASGTAWTAGSGPRAECLTPAIIGGNELFCKLNLAGGHLVQTSGAAQTGTDVVVPVGTYSLAVVSDGGVDALFGGTASVSVVSSGSTFTVADF
ncbi:IPT/TIG domain-containing protein [Actinoplanes utahensis]|uniref:IPT/TIG domain-containing protein n=1 Tax=Actinoplanes utahensis TaxID=1869 RepID=A0A0A6UGD3_ACTUT|nr:IPT/TIG domain-containing protein [Actinoplanes utahensis]KHD74521.1 hypothetical protein MB27_28295 [Actinoplanes utahensis]GIF28768.1 hypothetical protein Aut01nite_17540 [Actinoplanes utahensis]